MSSIVLRCTQCFFALGEEAPKPVVGGRVTLFHGFGSRRLGQWVFRSPQFILGTTAVNGRHAARLAEIPAMASSDRGRREVGGLDGWPDQGEMERWRKIRRGQFGQRKTPKLASEPCDRLTMHRDGVPVGTVVNGTLGGSSFSGDSKKLQVDGRQGHVHNRQPRLSFTSMLLSYFHRPPKLEAAVF